MRQLTGTHKMVQPIYLSKLPMRQLTALSMTDEEREISKLPMRQLTIFRPFLFRP